MESTKVICIDGLSGTGKTTLVEYLEKLYEPKTVSIRLGIIFRHLASIAIKQNINGLQILDSNAISESISAYLNDRTVYKYLFDSTINEKIIELISTQGLREQVYDGVRDHLDTIDDLLIILEGREVAKKLFPKALLKINLVTEDVIRQNRVLKRSGTEKNIPLFEADKEKFAKQIHGSWNIDTSFLSVSDFYELARQIIHPTILIKFPSMDPMTTIVTALVAGASAAVSDTVKSAAKDLYSTLKNKVSSKLNAKEDEEKLEKEIKQIQDKTSVTDTGEKLYENAIAKISEVLPSELTADQEVLGLARKVLELDVVQNQIKGSNILNNYGTIKGLVQGNSGTINMKFD